MRIIEFILAVIVIEITPGPNMAYLATLAAMHGRRAGFAAVSGIATGLALYGILAALGLTELMETEPRLYHALRWAGVCYLLWLAFEAWRGPDWEASSRQFPPTHGKLIWRGFLVNMLNPKAAIFYVSILPDFLDPASPDFLIENLKLVALYVVIATAAHMAIVISAAFARPWLIQGRRSALWLQRFPAAVLVLIALWIALETGP